MPSQLTDTILMIAPDSFGYNMQTAGSNSFQNKSAEEPEVQRKKALNEFNAMTQKLSDLGVDLLILSNDNEVDTPDAVFPNNWFATYEDGTVILFPMLSENRRLERSRETLEEVFDSSDLAVSKYIDYSEYEKQGLILEGTGSLVLDRKNNTVYAIESERTDKVLFERYCSDMNVPEDNRIFFHAYDESGSPIYHTNVIMGIGEGFAVICSECIQGSEQAEVISKLRSSGLEVIEISYSQLKNFCGNILNVKNIQGESLIVMSSRAFSSFTAPQLEVLRKYGTPVDVNIDTIETIGGGSARCMMAEIFLQKK